MPSLVEYPFYKIFQANNYCLHELRNNCSGIAFSNDGKIRIYTYLDLTSFTDDSSWTTFFNSRAPDANVNSIRSFEDVDRCCPRVSEFYTESISPLITLFNCVLFFTLLNLSVSCYSLIINTQTQSS